MLVKPLALGTDLEFDRIANPGVDGDSLTDRLLAAVAAAALQRFGIDLGNPTADVVTELDSCTSAKFSRHLVVRLQGAAFATAMDAGAFVAGLLALSGDTFAVRKVGCTSSTCFSKVGDCGESCTM